MIVLGTGVFIKGGKIPPAQITAENSDVTKKGGQETCPRGLGDIQEPMILLTEGTSHLSKNLAPSSSQRHLI